MNLMVDFFLKNKMGHFHIIDFPMGGSENRRKHFSGEIPKQIHGLYRAKIKTIEKQKYKQYQRNNMINTPRFTQDTVH